MRAKKPAGAAKQAALADTLLAVLKANAAADPTGGSHRKTEVHMLAQLRDDIPDALDTLIDDGFPKWPALLEQLADELFHNRKTFRATILAGAILDGHGLRHCELVLCDSRVGGPLNETVRDLIASTRAHLANMLTDKKPNLDRIEFGLRTCARLLRKAEPLLPIDEAAKRAGWPMNSAGHCDAARRAAKWKRGALPVQRRPLRARISDCRAWLSKWEQVSKSYSRANAYLPLQKPELPQRETRASRPRRGRG
ncbi:MAG: hypothetical protein WAT39_19525 [Planctomycetota bacterium]